MVRIRSWLVKITNHIENTSFSPSSLRNRHLHGQSGDRRKGERDQRSIWVRLFTGLSTHSTIDDPCANENSRSEDYSKSSRFRSVRSSWWELDIFYSFYSERLRLDDVLCVKKMRFSRSLWDSLHERSSASGIDDFGRGKRIRSCPGNKLLLIHWIKIILGSPRPR